jgi:hypothetical protein
MGMPETRISSSRFTMAENPINKEPIPKQFLTTADKRLQKENRSNSTIFFPI